MDFFLDFEKLAIARGLLDLTTLILQTSCNSLLTLLLPEQDTQVAARSGQDLFIHVRWLSGYVISREIFHLRPRLHEQIKPPLLAQIINPYEVTTDKFAQINHVLFAHVNAA